MGCIDPVSSRKVVIVVISRRLFLTYGTVKFRPARETLLRAELTGWISKPNLWPFFHAQDAWYSLVQSAHLMTAPPASPHKLHRYWTQLRWYSIKRDIQILPQSNADEVQRWYPRQDASELNRYTWLLAWRQNTGREPNPALRLVCMRVKSYQAVAKPVVIYGRSEGVGIINNRSSGRKD